MTYGAPYGSAEGAGDQPPRPPSVREQVTASKEFFAANSPAQVTQAASLIFRKHWGDISQFINGQRQMGMVLPATYKQVNYVDLSIDYRRWGNQETIILTAYPDATNPNPQNVLIDLNFDGYVAWVHWQDQSSIKINDVDATVGPFDIFFNGYLIEKDFQPSAICGGYVIMFGPTALLAQSYEDDQGRDFNDLINSNRHDALQGVTPRPGWGTYPDGASPTGVRQVDETVQLGYWIFNWTNHFNQCRYIQRGSNYEVWESITKGQVGSALGLSKALWFADATKSPLNPKGMNQMGVMLSPQSKSDEVLVAGVFTAEFYDRAKMRAVKTSWKYDAGNNGVVNLNDYPLLWGAGYVVGGFWSGAGISFDLTAKKDKPDPNEPSAPLGPHDGIANAQFGSGTGGTGLSDADQALLDNWHNTVRAMVAAYNASIQTYITAWTNKWNTSDNLKLINQARNVEAWFQSVVDKDGNYIVGLSTTTGDPTGQDRVNVLGPGRTFLIFGPVQEYWWDWNHTYTGVNPLPKADARYDATFSLVTQDIFVIDTLGNPGTPPNRLGDFGGSLANFNANMSVQAAFNWAKEWIKTDALAQKLDEYNQIFRDHPAPAYPDRPRVGQDYTKFKYRFVTIAEGVWSYPPTYSGGS